uniref:Metalloendopeptidase n=1 Tax=Gouania willdenowi TaxID=441366 RepID=A0A8C5DWG9_GOUWI
RTETQLAARGRRWKSPMTSTRIYVRKSEYDMLFIILNNVHTGLFSSLSTCCLRSVTRHRCLTSCSCASYVGFIGGEQPVFIGSRCIVGNIVHEILHALGFQHEHTRLDRENYITIFAENIMSGMEKNFKKHNGETFSLPYDIQSILHYGRQFFSANGKPTIIANEYEGPMGQRANLTWTDIEKVRKLYRCGELC